MNSRTGQDTSSVGAPTTSTTCNGAAPPTGIQYVKGTLAIAQERQNAEAYNILLFSGEGKTRKENE